MNQLFAKNYILRYLTPINKNCSEVEFEFVSFNRWAVDAAFNFVDAHPDMSTRDALELFIKTMDNYSCMARSEKSSRMFAQAKNMGEDILDHYLISEFRLPKNGGNKE